MRRHTLDTPVSYYTIFLFTRYIPIGLCHFLGKITALIVYAFSRRDRAGLGYNLSLALQRPPDDPFIRRTIRRIFINYGRYLVDFFYLPQLSRVKARRFFSHLQNKEILDQAISEGKGVIILSAHVGNWEVSGNMAEHPMAVVAMAHNTDKTEGLVNRLRNNQGVRQFVIEDSLFSGIEILHYLRNNGIVAMIGDKDFWGTGKVISFFGKKVVFPVGPVVLAMTTGAALLPAFVLMQPDGRYFGIVEKPIVVHREGDRDQAIEKNLMEITAVFERYIRQYPDQWYCPDPIALETDS
ncbi:MAG: lysophospholipid acyltransferase family protein [Deltaproteobacteria bacterium]|nr:lysophospholipid acyltransferase family protein [Deltaproteobacteria bacterium]